MWQNTKNTRIVMYLPFIYEMLVSRYFFLGVEWVMKSYAFSTIAILFVILITNIDKIKLLKNMNKKLIS